MNIKEFSNQTISDVALVKLGKYGHIKFAVKNFSEDCPQPFLQVDSYNCEGEPYGFIHRLPLYLVDANCHNVLMMLVAWDYTSKGWTETRNKNAAFELSRILKTVKTT